MVEAPYTVEEAMKLGWKADKAKAFSEFMTKVNQRVEQKTGLGVLDFPDWHWADAFSSQCGVAETVTMFLSDMKEDGYGF